MALGLIGGLGQAAKMLASRKGAGAQRIMPGGPAGTGTQPTRRAGVPGSIGGMLGGIFRRNQPRARGRRVIGGDTPQRQALGASIGRVLGPGMFSSPVVSAMEEPFGRKLVRGHHSRAKRSGPRRSSGRR